MLAVRRTLVWPFLTDLGVEQHSDCSALADQGADGDFVERLFGLAKRRLPPRRGSSPLLAAVFRFRLRLWSQRNASSPKAWQCGERFAPRDEPRLIVARTSWQLASFVRSS